MARNQLPNDPGTPAPPPRRTTPTPAPPVPPAPPDVVAGRVLNPPFDQRILSVGGSGPVGQMRPYKKGLIRSWLAPNHQINFLFNPSVVNTGFNMDPSAVLDPQAMDPNGPPPALAGEGSVSLDLLFDRTYEVWSRAAVRESAGPYVAQYVAATFGAHIDVLAFYMFTGMLSFKDWQSIQGKTWEDLYPKAQLTYKPSFLYVGPNLKFFGYIESLSVLYSHFSQDMIPMRAAISIKFITQSYYFVAAQVAGGDDHWSRIGPGPVDPGYGGGGAVDPFGNPGGLYAPPGGNPGGLVPPPGGNPGGLIPRPGGNPGGLVGS